MKNRFKIVTNQQKDIYCEDIKIMSYDKNMVMLKISDKKIMTIPKNNIVKSYQIS